jgi:3-dehydroquinate synthase
VTGVVRVELGDRSCEVLLGAGSLDGLARRAAAAHRTVALLADGDVAALHGDRVVAALESAGARVRLRTLPPGERAKSIAVVEEACRALIRDGLERGDAVCGLGGGAATDTAGFVAAVLLRGVPWFALPTSLLGQVDAAVGGKTGVNLPEGKNLVGAFHQPRAVACDPSFLATLPARELRAGLAEVVKTAWIGDAELFQALEADPPRSADHPALGETVRRCVAVKASIVSRDEREGGLRAVLNFGHTLGHAIETEAGGRWLHGEAVALGMVAAVHISVETGRCDASLLDRLVRLLDSVGLPVGDRDLDPDAVLERARVDKKRTGGVPAYQLTAGLGLVSVAADLPERAPRAALQFLRR